MASFKITDLTELTGGSVADTDVLEIVDLDADQSKKVTIASLKTVFSASEGSSYTGGTANGIMFNDGDTFATSSNLVFDGANVAIGGSISTSYRLLVQGNFRTNGGFIYNGSLLLNGAKIYNSSTTNGAINLSTSNLVVFEDMAARVDLVDDDVAQTINLSNGQTADAFQINSYGNTGGDLFGIDADGNVGIGATPTSKLQVVGRGSTSSTTNFLLQNASSTPLFKVYDDGVSQFGNFTRGTGVQPDDYIITTGRVRAGGGITFR